MNQSSLSKVKIYYEYHETLKEIQIDLKKRAVKNIDK